MKLRMTIDCMEPGCGWSKFAYSLEEAEEKMSTHPHFDVVSPTAEERGNGR